MIDIHIKEINRKIFANLLEEKIKEQINTLDLKEKIMLIDDITDSFEYVDRSLVEDKKEYHVNELMRYSDEDFIKNCYRAILKREFDQNGYDNFLGKLRTTKLHKIEIISRLYFSKESKQKNIKLKGLYLRLFIRVLYKIPILGYFIRLILSILRLPIILKNNEKFEIQIMSELNFLKNNINSNVNKNKEIDKNFIQKINNNFVNIIENLNNKKYKNEI